MLLNDLAVAECVSEASIQMISLQAFFRFAGTRVGFLKLAREEGMANQGVASGYLEKLADLLCVLPGWQWDDDRRILMVDKPCKVHCVNLAAAIALHPGRLVEVARGARNLAAYLLNGFPQ